LAGRISEAWGRQIAEFSIELLYGVEKVGEEEDGLGEAVMELMDGGQLTAPVGRRSVEVEEVGGLRFD
jgi:hypothetical protein